VQFVGLYYTRICLLYDVPFTCFGLYMAILIKDYSNASFVKDVHIWSRNLLLLYAFVKIHPRGPPCRGRNM